MFMLNNQPLPLDTPFAGPDGTQYPANWLRLASEDEKAAIGITEVPDAPFYDDRFYWSLGNPKNLDDLKKQMIGQIKATAGSMLSATDWKVVRAAEGVKPCDEATLAERAAIREASNNFEAAINSCATVDDLAALAFTWPQAERV